MCRFGQFFIRKTDKITKKPSFFFQSSEDVISKKCVYYNCPKYMKYFIHKKGDHHENFILRNQKLRSAVL